MHRGALVTAAVGIAIAAAVVIGLRRRDVGAQCSDGFSAQGARCIPQGCPPPLALVGGVCDAPDLKIEIPENGVRARPVGLGSRRPCFPAQRARRRNSRSTHSKRPSDTCNMQPMMPHAPPPEFRAPTPTHFANRAAGDYRPKTNGSLLHPEKKRAAIRGATPARFVDVRRGDLPAVRARAVRTVPIPWDPMLLATRRTAFTIWPETSPNGQPPMTQPTRAGRRARRIA